MSIKSFYITLASGFGVAAMLYLAFSAAYGPAEKEITNSELSIGISSENPLYEIQLTDSRFE
ncbi:MAG: hypothetical protein HRT71_09415 [Flavobacteriales bacterium]|nr:hypothetical protein [Flavobacteriales bacterium]